MKIKIILTCMILSVIIMIGCADTSNQKSNISDTEKMFITKNGEYFDFYRLKQVIEEDTGKKCNISEFSVSNDKTKYNDAYVDGLETYECKIETDSWANGIWQSQRHFGEKINENPKNGYAFPLYLDEKLENAGTIVSWKK